MWQSEVAVVQAPPGAAASAPAEGMPPGLSVSVTVAPTNSSVAAPLIVGAAPSPGRRHLLVGAVISNGTGVDTNVTITAPATELSNITSLLQLAVSSGSLQQQLHNAGKWLAAAQSVCLSSWQCTDMATDICMQLYLCLVCMVSLLEKMHLACLSHDASCQLYALQQQCGTTTIRTGARPCP